MLRRCMIAFAAILVLPATWPVQPWAQQVPAASSEARVFGPQQLDALLAPIALYPDTLLTQLLMATTFPLQVVAAERWLQDPAHRELKGDALVHALAKVDWDPSVKSLVPFPQVVAQLNGNLDWMQQVGYAFAAQQRDVFDSIQRLRRQAQSTGHLESTPQQVVRTEPALVGEQTTAPAGQQTAAPAGQPTIIIEPAQADTVYVPSYNPAVVYGAWPYPSYPPVYMPPPPGYAVGTALASGLAFGAGVALTAGLWGWASNNWNSGDVNVNVNRWNNINTNRQRTTSNVWRASARPGGLPPNLRRAPAGPVGRPARANGLPANAIGRQNVSLPGSVVDRPGRENRRPPTQGNRPDLAPGSRPGQGASRPGNRAGQGNRAEIGQANRPRGEARPNRGTEGSSRRADTGAANRPAGRPAPKQPGAGQRNRPAAAQPSRAGGPRAGQAGARSGAFGGMNEGSRASQFSQRGGQSRQFSAARGSGNRQAGGGGSRGGGSRGGGGRGGGSGGRR